MKPSLAHSSPSANGLDLSKVVRLIHVNVRNVCFKSMCNSDRQYAQPLLCLLIRDTNKDKPGIHLIINLKPVRHLPLQDKNGVSLLSS